MPEHPKEAVRIGHGSRLTIEDVVRVSRSLDRSRRSEERAQAILTEPARRRMVESRDWVRSVVSALSSSDRPPASYYGINTGFGSLAGRTTLDSEALTRVLTRNLIVSHAAGVREYFDEETVRAAILLRAHSLAQGYSGIRIRVVEALINMLNGGIYPAVPCMGSLGASGDLAPLSHLALVISKPPQGDDDPSHTGEAFAPTRTPGPQESLHLTEHRLSGRQVLWATITGSQAMEGVGGQIELVAKEGLALNNGTTFSSALAALTLSDARNLLENADLSLSMTLESICGFADPFFEEVHQVRGHSGAAATAERVRSYSAGSQLLDGSHEQRPRRVPPQDPYSIRCAPQVHGAIRDTLDFVERSVETELNAATDNPLIFLHLHRDYKAVSCGNFHGEPVALAMDFLGIAMTELASISERRIFKMTDYATDRPHGLPSFLIDDQKTAGLNSGLMMPQYTAASLVSECKTLSHPDSVDSIPSSANQEDHVSMSLNAARHARQIVDNVEFVVAIEFLCAAQALEWRQRQDPALSIGRGTQAALRHFRSRIGYLEKDRVLYPDLQEALLLVRSGELVEAARNALKG